MNDSTLQYFREFPVWLEDIVDAFLFTKDLDLENDERAQELKDRAHALRWDIHDWLWSTYG